MAYLDKALADGSAQLSQVGTNKIKINYKKYDKSFVLDPEELVRANYWAELIYLYDYDPSCIDIDVAIPDRPDRADIVIFTDSNKNRLFAVIECKKEGITDSEFNQAIEQVAALGNWSNNRARYLGVIAGSTRRFFDYSPKFGIFEREINIIADLPSNYGNLEEFKYRKNGRYDLQPVSKDSLISIIKKCHQTLWDGGKRSPPIAFGELCKIIFVKISDERIDRNDGEPYEFQIKKYEPSDRLADRIRALYAKQKDKDPDVFKDPLNIEDATLRIVVSHLEGINLTKTDLDVKGLAFEQFMDSFFKGDYGQFFTPREIISFAIDMVNPKQSDFILDPACGSGGFLLYAFDKIRKEIGTPSKQKEKELCNFAKTHLFGLEINDEIVRVAKMNMIIHGDGHANVCNYDALDSFERIRDRTRNNGFKENYFDLVLTNPPFGAQKNFLEFSELENYNLGRQTDANGHQKTRKNQKMEILFIERILQFLKPMGKAAIILPDGILTNSSTDYVRDFILSNFQILAIVSLPQTAFSHFGAGVKSSVVFLRKRGADEQIDNNEPIFMAIAENIGYDATGRVCENQLPEISQKYKEFLGNPDPFFL
jgi:type I restriction enzyme M protein